MHACILWNVLNLFRIFNKMFNLRYNGEWGCLSDAPATSERLRRIWLLHRNGRLHNQRSVSRVKCQFVCAMNVTAVVEGNVVMGLRLQSQVSWIGEWTISCGGLCHTTCMCFVGRRWPPWFQKEVPGVHPSGSHESEYSIVVVVVLVVVVV